MVVFRVTVGAMSTVRETAMSVAMAVTTAMAMVKGMVMMVTVGTW